MAIWYGCVKPAPVCVSVCLGSCHLEGTYPHCPVQGVMILTLPCSCIVHSAVWVGGVCVCAKITLCVYILTIHVNPVPSCEMQLVTLNTKAVT